MIAALDLHNAAVAARERCNACVRYYIRIRPSKSAALKECSVRICASVLVSPSDVVAQSECPRAIPGPRRPARPAAAKLPRTWTEYPQVGSLVCVCVFFGTSLTLWQGRRPDGLEYRVHHVLDLAKNANNHEMRGFICSNKLSAKARQYAGSNSEGLIECTVGDSVCRFVFLLVFLFSKLFFVG